MFEYHELPPSAASLALSLRDLGYSLETAVADIIDNSISAGATKVEIFCDLSLEEPAMSILDNGSGMDANELLSAMRPGGKGPNTIRLASDLGRFGLGLKTASFSQGRRLTVVSLQKNNLVGAEWDLDRVIEEDRWIVSTLTSEQLCVVPCAEKLSNQGTLVVWRTLDRLFEGDEGANRSTVVNNKLTALRDHLSLVFHRFLAGEATTGKLEIKVNGHTLSPFDPFCTNNKATQRLPKEVVPINGHRVEIQAFILPHHSHLSPREHEFYRTRSDFVSNQGVYVYRNYRLMAWGDWFRLAPKGESTKLGRVRIDFPSALDGLWTIDIKKSRAEPPRVVREHLRQILEKITGAAVKVHRGRGSRMSQDTNTPIWERFAERGQIRYSLNKSHPIVVQLLAQLSDAGQRTLVALLDSIAASLPIDLVYSDYSSEPKAFALPKSTEDEALERLRALKLALYGKEEYDYEQFLTIVCSTGLFVGHDPLVQRFILGEIK